MDLNLIREGITNSTPIYQSIAWLIPAIMGGASLLAGWLGNRNKNNQQQQQSSSYSNSTMPQYDSEVLDARNKALGLYENRVNDTQGYLTGYTGQGMRGINKTADIRSQSLASILAARGLGSSPMAAAMQAQGEDQRMSQQVQFQNTIPLLQRQMEGENLDAFSKFIASLPTGVTQSGTSSSSGTGTQTGTSGGVGQGISDAATNALLAYYMGQKK